MIIYVYPNTYYSLLDNFLSPFFHLRVLFNNINIVVKPVF